ncbi:MAG: AmmeMemoRadiSam system protein B [DPANN group archaeon]|nr:AmmeMemoRadiSam system protein B [DPANN group archaeon]
MREPIAGGFYPENKVFLEIMLDKFMLKKNTKKSNVIGAVVPHAGYLYSGNTAAEVYNNLKKKYDSVIIIGPDHTGLAKSVSLSDEDWNTPLGSIQIDMDLSNKIIKNLDIASFDNTAHMYEHSIEVQLPMLLRVLGNFKFIPIIIPSTISDMDTLEKIGLALRKSIGDLDVLVIASSDFTHFGRGYGFVPVKTDEIKWIHNMDKTLIDDIINLNPIKLIEHAELTTACGIEPICVMLSCIKKQSKKGKCLKYTTSFEVSGIKNAIVGYSGIIFE